MALTQLEQKRCELALAAFLERRRPPPHIRHQLDFGYKVTGHIVEIFETRPDWREHTKKHDTPIAKTTFVRTQNHWKTY